MRALLSDYRTAAALWVLAASLCAFLLMGLDKWKAKRGAWRVPERTLWLAALLGGAPGGCLGMYCFRHKTRHTAFRYGFPLLALAELGALIWVNWMKMI